ncbi:MAG: hypothetical protein IPO27_00020 [Bacteroidetes bacterium]|nr:hypothetical protein [Bacteroidota bacterium]
MVLGSIGVNGATNSVNVGIGISAPTSSLHIKGQGSTSATSALTIQNSSATNLVVVKDNGNVGIATSSPAKKLHVFDGLSGGTPAYFDGILIENNNTTFLQFLTPNNTQNGILFGTAADAFSGSITYNYIGNKGLSFGSNGNASKMVLDSIGNVGIGTLRPLSDYM